MTDSKKRCKKCEDYERLIKKLEKDTFIRMSPDLLKDFKVFLRNREEKGKTSQTQTISSSPSTEKTEPISELIGFVQGYNQGLEDFKKRVIKNDEFGYKRSRNILDLIEEMKKK